MTVWQYNFCPVYRAHVRSVATKIFQDLEIISISMQKISVGVLKSAIDLEFVVYLTIGNSEPFTLEGQGGQNCVKSADIFGFGAL